MIITSLLNAFEKKSVYAIWYKEEGLEKQQILEFDSIREAEFEATSNVTDYPVENGVSITDYKYDNPDILTVVGVISRTNASLVDINEAYLLGRDELINKTRQALDRYKRGIYRLQIQTKSGLYDWMTLRDYTIPENYDNYGLFEVEMTFLKIIRPDEELYPKQVAYSDTISIGHVFTKVFDEVYN